MTRTLSQMHFSNVPAFYKWAQQQPVRCCQYCWRRFLLAVLQNHLRKEKKKRNRRAAEEPFEQKPASGQHCCGACDLDSHLDRSHFKMVTILSHFSHLNHQLQDKYALRMFPWRSKIKADVLNKLWGLNVCQFQRRPTSKVHYEQRTLTLEIETATLTVTREAISQRLNMLTYLCSQQRIFNQLAAEKTKDCGIMCPLIFFLIVRCCSYVCCFSQPELMCPCCMRHYYILKENNSDFFSPQKGGAQLPASTSAPPEPRLTAALPAAELLLALQPGTH